MPITADTLRDQKRLNAVFAVSGTALLAVTVWMLLEDHNAEWKAYQGRYQSNVALLASLELARYSGPDFERQLAAAGKRVEDLSRALESDERYRRLADEEYAARQQLAGAALRYNDAKSVLDVLRQDYERAVAASGEGSAPAEAARREMLTQARLVDEAARERERLEDLIAERKRDMKAMSQERDAAAKSLAALQRRRDEAAQRLRQNEDSFLNRLRNGPLDFAVRTEEVKGGYVADVYDQLNFMRFPRIDRCQTCHVAIDDRRFTDEELVVSLALSVAAVNQQRAAAGREPVPLPFDLPTVSLTDAAGNPLPEEEYLRRLAGLDAERERFIRDLWDRLELDNDRQRQKEVFQAVVSAVNELRRSEGQPPLDLDHPLRAHPNLDLYVSPTSKHPIKQMGCTVCHGGNGDETSFTTAIHAAESRAQEREWIRKYEGRIDYSLAQHWWNEPMLQSKYVEASCLKCHREGADVARHENRALATRITEGRQLFTQVGCTNCHKVEGLEEMRKVGPDLTHLPSKLSPEFVQSWIWYPRDFRPSTWMPHLFKQENNFAPSGVPDDPDPDPLLRTQTEVAAITHYLYSFSTPYEPERPPERLTGDAERGRQLFDSVGCLACHAALAHRRTPDGPPLGEAWIAADLAHREALDPVKAVARARGMTYAEQARYAMEHFTRQRREQALRQKEQTTWALRKAQLAGRAEEASALQKRLDGLFVPPEFTRFAPELSGIGSKVSPEWLYDWLRDPRHYHSYAKMPSLRLTPQEALDLAAYLSTFKNPEFKPTAFEMTPERRAMMDHLILLLLEGQNSRQASQRILADEGGRLTAMLDKLIRPAFPDPAARKARLDALDLEGRKLAFLGSRMINHYGCYACHAIPGFETTSPPGTELTYWYNKPLKQLDFAFFEHVFEHTRGPEFKTLYPESEAYAHLLRDAAQREIEPVHSHAWFAWQKVRNPRIFDRGKLKAPYEKLKMPNFFFTDAEADALTTYLLSRSEPLVTDKLVPAPQTHLPAIARGRNLTVELNCVGCHQIEANPATMHQFITPVAAAGAEMEDWEGEEDQSDAQSGAKGRTPADEARDVIAAGTIGDFDEVNGPPWLRGQGAKVQPAWLADFFSNVRTLRPWLKTRMPSFHLTTEQAATLVEYFAALSQRESEILRRHLEPVRKYMATQTEESLADPSRTPAGRTPGDDWHRQPALKASARFLAEYATANRLMLPLDFRYEPASDEMRESFRQARLRAEFIERLYDIDYPFDATARSAVDEPRFELGRALTIDVLNCLACHALGDPNVPGANRNPSAPNLSLTFRRLRPDWVHAWLQEPGWIQPGTKMPQWFPGGRTAFADFPNRAEQEAKFGASGEAQMRLLMDFLYEAGERAYTGVPGGGADQKSVSEREPATRPDEE